MNELHPEILFNDNMYFDVIDCIRKKSTELCKSYCKRINLCSK